MKLRKINVRKLEEFSVLLWGESQVTVAYTTLKKANIRVKCKEKENT